MEEKQLVAAVDQWIAQHRDELVQDIIRAYERAAQADKGRER